MNPLENCLLLAGLPPVLVLAGYWLAARLSGTTAAERLSAAVLIGLAVLVWNLSVVAFFKPISGGWAWLCLWPVAATFASAPARTALGRDAAEVVFSRRGALAGLVLAAFFAVLLWPLLTRTNLLFYDGTSNHDAFFWIGDAEHLRRHTYMDAVVPDALHPYANATNAMIGWRPAWGRIGDSGLLALVSAIIGVAPLKLYVTATAVLLIPWVAAVFLVARTFFVERPATGAVLAAIGLQPLFVFFHENANLPNLLGMIGAATVLFATERSLRAPKGQRAPWLLLVTLAVHAAFACYSEMWPFVALPTGLLWLRAALRKRPVAEIGRPALATLTALVAGLAINPVSTVRGWFGFYGAFLDARQNDRWGNLFSSLSWTEYPPALLTLAFAASKNIGPIVAAAVSVALIVGVVLAYRRAQDKTGATMIMAGGFLLGLYTIAAGFGYGWQKTVQFTSIFIAAAMPLAAVHQLSCAPVEPRWRRHTRRAALATLLAFITYATVSNCMEGHHWSRTKLITRDWFDVRDYAREHLHNQPVLIEGASFRMAFFHGMWATFFLNESPIYFAARGEQGGGYLRDTVVNEAKQPIPTPAAVLEGRDWADAFDRNSKRLINGDTVVLLETVNRVTAMTGLRPENGVPENADGEIALTVRPHSRSKLVLVLDPRTPARRSDQRWRLTATVNGQPRFKTEIASPPPWRLEFPLEPGQSNRLEAVAAPLPGETVLPPFIVRSVSIDPVSG